MTQLFKGLPLNIQLFSADPNPDDKTLDKDIDDLFKDIEDDSSPSEPSKTDPNKTDPTLTETMTKRINEVKNKTEKETLDKVAKELGYVSYAEMQKAKEADLIKKAGYNPDDLNKVIEPLVQKRLADDPRLREFETLKKREQELYVEAQLKSINEATGQQLKVSDLSKETIELWSKGVELEQAYFATQGKTIIAQVKAQAQNGSMSHLSTGSGSGSVKTRGLTEAEKQIYRQIAPHLTEEDLNKKTIEVKIK